MDYSKYLKFYPDFPIEGVNFVDIMPFIQDREVFASLADDIGKQCLSPNIAAPEARGFLFTAPLLMNDSGVENVIPFRKSGKLPYRKGDLVEIEIQKEYGKDKIYFRLSDVAAGKAADGVFNITFFDDILATGGTASGIAKALNNTKVELDGKTYSIKVTDFVFLVEIDDLKGRDILQSIAPVKSIIHV